MLIRISSRISDNEIGYSVKRLFYENVNKILCTNLKVRTRSDAQSTFMSNCTLYSVLCTALVTEVDITNCFGQKITSTNLLNALLRNKQNIKGMPNKMYRVLCLLAL